MGAALMGPIALVDPKLPRLTASMGGASAAPCLLMECRLRQLMDLASMVVLERSASGCIQESRRPR